MSAVEHVPRPFGHGHGCDAIDNKLAAAQRSDKGAQPNASREEADWIPRLIRADCEPLAVASV